MPTDVTPTQPPTTPPAGEPPAPPEPTPEDTWDGWLATLDEAERGRVTRLYEAKHGGLLKALDSERNERKATERQLRDAAAKLKDDDANKAQLTQMADQLDLANRKADFFQEAAKPENGLADPEAAWIIANAKADEFFDRRGNLNLALLKERHPSLFARPPVTPPANAGNGSGVQPPAANTMNQMIRRQAGRG
jgi:hypothetical protein